MRRFVLSLLLLGFVAACGAQDSDVQRTPLTGEGVVIFSAETVITMSASDTGNAIAVRDGAILAVDALAALEQRYPGAELDQSFADKTIVPGLIDPHVHMSLSSLQYATPLTPPWPMATPQGMVRGLPNRAAFFERLQEIVDAAPEGEIPRRKHRPGAASAQLLLDAISTTRERPVRKHIRPVSKL